MEYANQENRTTKKDLKRKRLYNKYKKGGSSRTRDTTYKIKTNDNENDEN